MDVIRSVMLAWLLSHGYADYQAQAIIHSAWIETRLQPCRVGRSGSYLFQWAGPRLRALHRFAGVGCPPIAKQLVFMDAELRGIPAFAGFWQQRTEITAFRVFRCAFERGRRRC